MDMRFWLNPRSRTLFPQWEKLFIHTLHPVRPDFFLKWDAQTLFDRAKKTYSEAVGEPEGLGSLFGPPPTSKEIFGQAFNRHEIMQFAVLTQNIWETTLSTIYNPPFYPMNMNPNWCLQLLKHEPDFTATRYTPYFCPECHEFGELTSELPQESKDNKILFDKPSNEDWYCKNCFEEEGFDGLGSLFG
jgi:hypothetical protein